MSADSLNKYKKIVLTLIFTICTMISFFSNGSMPITENILKQVKIDNIFVIFAGKLFASLDMGGIITSVVFISLYIFYFKFFKKYKIEIIAVVISILYSIFMVLGKSFELYDSWDYVFGNGFQILFSIMRGIGWYIFFYYLLIILFNSIEKYNQKEIWHKSSLLKPGLLMLLLWLPIIIVFFPGSMVFDSFRMLTLYNGQVTWVASHPVVPTVLLGIIMDLSLKLGSANLGAFLCVLIQTVFMIAVFCLILNFIKQLDSPKFVYTATVLFFTLCPIWASYAHTIIKDTLNLVFCLLYFVAYLQILYQPEWIKEKKNCVLFVCIMILACLYRNTGIYLISLSGIPMAIYLFKNNKNYAISVLICVLVATGGMGVFNKCIVPAMDILPGSKGEMLSIPFQQTARYLKEWPDDVEEWEKQAIDNVLDYDVLAQKYNPNLSDPVKGTLHSQDSEDISQYFKAWGSMFVKHPSVYVEATMNGIYNYFYPDSISKSRTTGLKFYITAPSENGPNTGQYDVHYVHDKGIRNGFVNFINVTWLQIPVLGMCYNTGVYTWILILCAAVLLRYKKYSAILGLVPSFLTILFCIASPVNGYVRYMLPVIAATPLIIAWTLYSIRIPINASLSNKRIKKGIK